MSPERLQQTSNTGQQEHTENTSDEAASIPPWLACRLDPHSAQGVSEKRLQKQEIKRKHITD